MKIIIDIPKVFEIDLNEKGAFGELNYFVEFFKRVQSVIKLRDGICGNYELEIAEMFADAFSEVQTINDNEIYDEAINDFMRWAYMKGVDFSFMGKIVDGKSNVPARLKEIKTKFMESRKAE